MRLISGTAVTVAAAPVVNTPSVNTNIMQPPPSMVPMQHRMPNQFGGPIAAPFGAAPFGMPPPGFQPFGGYGPPQAGWGNLNLHPKLEHIFWFYFDFHKNKFLQECLK